MQKTKRIRQWLEAILIACLLVFLAKVFLFFPTKVEGASMMPTLEQGDKIIVSKISAYTHRVEHGDIVVVKADDYYVVKRVIGLSGETIEVKDDVLYINDKKQEEAYLTGNQEEATHLMRKLTEDFGPVTVPKGEIFVMGDNRVVSRDSRNGLGTIDTKEIIGVVKAIYYPVESIRLVK